MDPMTYSEESGSEDSDKLHKRDMGFLSNALIRYIGSGKPGIAAFFVYGLGPALTIRPGSTNLAQLTRLGEHG